MKIKSITFGLDEASSFEVGSGDVTEIKLTEKSGSMASIPYLQVFKNGHLHSEHCQHNVTGVYFEAPASA